MLRVTGLCVGNSPGTDEFPAQMASYAENVSIGWRHHDVNKKPQQIYNNPKPFVQTEFFNNGDSVTVAISVYLYFLPFLDTALQWRHNEPDGVSNHQVRHCLLNRLFRRWSNKTSNFRVTGLCSGIHRWPVNFPHKWPVTRKMFPFHDAIMDLAHVIDRDPSACIRDPFI